MTFTIPNTLRPLPFYLRIEVLLPLVYNRLMPAVIGILLLIMLNAFAEHNARQFCGLRRKYACLALWAIPNSAVMLGVLILQYSWHNWDVIRVQHFLVLGKVAIGTWLCLAIARGLAIACNSFYFWFKVKIALAKLRTRREADPQ